MNANPTFWELVATMRRTPDPAAEDRAARWIRRLLVAAALTPLLAAAKPAAPPAPKPMVVFNHLGIYWLDQFEP